jgi:excisionase family DNA binding protein
VTGENDLLRVSEIAKLLGVTPGRIYQLVAAQTLPAVRMGRSIRIPRQAWAVWLDQQCARALASVREREREVQVGPCD